MTFCEGYTDCNQPIPLLIRWLVNCYSIGDYLHTVLALPVHSIANAVLSSLKQLLIEVKHGCHAWFGWLHPHSLLGITRVLAMLGERECTGY